MSESIQQNKLPPMHFFNVKGEMVERIQQFDWANTTLGPICNWAPCVTTAVNIILCSPLPMASLWGREGIMIYNDAYSKFAGNRHPGGLGARVIHAWPEAALFMLEVIEVCMSGETLTYSDQPYTIYRKGAPEDIYLDVSFSPILNQAGETEGILVVNIETTERKLAQEFLYEQQVLKDSEESFKTLCDQAPTIVFMADEHGNFNYVNKKWLDFTGQTLEEACSIDGWRKVIHPMDYADAIATYNTAFLNQHCYSIEVRLLDSLGNYRYHLFTGGPKYQPNGAMTGFVGSGIETTLHKNAEHQVKESEHRFRMMADQVPQFIWMTTKAESSEVIDVTYANKYFLNYVGITDPKEFLGSTWEESIHPEDLNNVFEVYVSATLEEKAYMVECRFLDATSKVYKWFVIRGVPRFDAAGCFEGFIGTGIDINESKLMFDELELRNKQLMRVNDDLDNFVYTASHDLKSPISNIEGLINSLSLLLNNSSIDPDVALMMEHINTSLQKFKTTIHGLTEVSKVQREVEEDVCEVQIQSVIDDVKILITDLIQESNAIINTKIPCGKIRFSKANLQCIILNLLTNALKYRSPDRVAVIDIHCHEHNGCYRIEVRDNGLGIPAKLIDSIFKMFKRAHQHVDGSGIGLYLVKRIIDNAGGKIGVESEVGKGSKFIIYLTID